MWVELCYPKGFSVCCCELFWKWDLCRCNQVKVRSYTIRVGPNQDCYSSKIREIWIKTQIEEIPWRHIDTQGRTLCEDRDRNWNYAAIIQVMTKTIDNHQKQTDLPIREFMLCHFRWLSSGIVRWYISIDLSHPVGGTLLWQPKETKTTTKSVYVFITASRLSVVSCFFAVNDWIIVFCLPLKLVFCCLF